MDAATLLAKFEAYLLTEQRVSTNTIVAYKTDLKQFCDFLDGHKLALEQVQTAHLKEFLAFLHSLKLAPRSLARKVSSLKALFRYMSTRLDMPDRARDLHFPKIGRSLPRYLSEYEIEQLFAAADIDKSPHGMRNGLMLYLLYVSGMRISELVGLTLSDVRLDESLIAVDGKGGRQRLIPIPPAVCKIVAAYIDGARLIRHKKNSAGYLFPVMYAGRIKPMSRQAFWLILKRMCAGAGIARGVSLY